MLKINIFWMYDYLHGFGRYIFTLKKTQQNRYELVIKPRVTCSKVLVQWPVLVSEFLQVHFLNRTSSLRFKKSWEKLQFVRTIYKIHWISGYKRFFIKHYISIFLLLNYGVYRTFICNLYVHIYWAGKLHFFYFL